MMPKALIVVLVLLVLIVVALVSGSVWYRATWGLWPWQTR